MLGWQGRKIYLVTFLDIENSDRTKDTWCIPRYLNAVHEGAGDECAHEKLRADRFRLWCRDTSLPASSEATRTPPITESWIAAWLESFSWPTSELPLNVVSEDRGITCSARNGVDERDGKWQVGQKLTGGEQEWWWCRARKDVRLGTDGTDGGLPFYGRRGAATVIQNHSR
jgi:hypothetical protein